MWISLKEGLPSWSFLPIPGPQNSCLRLADPLPVPQPTLCCPKPTSCRNTLDRALQS